jgi:hypothetical protein
MTARSWTFGAGATVAAMLAIVGCKSQQPPASAGEVSAGTPVGTSGSGGPGSIPALVSVNLQNVLNDLSVSLKVNRDNIPVNAQVPIDVAASVCGVSVSALAASIASGQAGCTATTTSPQLTQAVQQQIASGGSVTGGDQTMGSPTNNMM